MNAKPRGGGSSARGGSAPRGGRGRGRGRPSRRGGASVTASGNAIIVGAGSKAVNRGPSSGSNKARAKSTLRSRAPRLAVKLAVRGLPPALSPADFFKVVDTLGASIARSRVYIPGDVDSVLNLYSKSDSVSGTHGAKTVNSTIGTTPGPGNGNVEFSNEFSVAFLGFANVDDAENFIDSMETAQTTFKDPVSGIEYFPCIERALNQAIARPERRSCLAAVGTIQSDPDFINFAAEYEIELEAERNAIAPPSLTDTDALFSGVPEAASILGESSISTENSSVREARTNGTRAKRGGVSQNNSSNSSTFKADDSDTSFSTRLNRAGAGVVPVTVIEGAGTLDPGVVVTPLIEEIRAKRREKELQSSAKRAGSASKAPRRAKRVGGAIKSVPPPGSLVADSTSKQLNESSTEVSPVSCSSSDSHFASSTRSDSKAGFATPKRSEESRGDSAQSASKVPGPRLQASRKAQDGFANDVSSHITGACTSSSVTERECSALPASTASNVANGGVADSQFKGHLSNLTPKRGGSRVGGRRGGRARFAKAAGGRGRGQLSNAAEKDGSSSSRGLNDGKNTYQSPSQHATRKSGSSYGSANGTSPVISSSVRLLRKVPRLEESSGG